LSKWLTTAPSEFVAEMICQQLVEEGIQPQTVNANPNPARAGTFAGGRDIYVDDRDLARARALLESFES
jgi:hypothetical protein